jgi:hypothetical protein
VWSKLFFVFFLKVFLFFFLFFKTIIADKLLGSFIKLTTENNDIVASAIYAENFNIKSKKSNISIKNAKGNGIIELENGKIDISKFFC